MLKPFGQNETLQALQDEIVSVDALKLEPSLPQKNREQHGPASS